MRRREFIALLRGAAIVYPLNAFAQQNLPFVQIRPVIVTPEEFRIAYPKVQAWIQKTLAAYEKEARPIASMHFARLQESDGPDITLLGGAAAAWPLTARAEQSEQNSRH